MASTQTNVKTKTKPARDLNGPDIGAIQPNVSVENVKEAVDFYTKLGFQTEMSMPGPGGGLTFALLSYKNCLLHVVGVDGQHPDAQRRTQIKKGPRGLGVIFYVQVDDVEAVHKTLVKNKVRVYQAPKDEFWGDRVCSCLDPFGYEWAFGQHIRDVSPEEMAKAAQAQAARN